MFDERRQRVTGIDKSYPLLPISYKFVPNNYGHQNRNTVTLYLFICTTNGHMFEILIYIQ